MIEVQNFINGQFTSCKSYIDSFDPSTGKVYAHIPDSDSGDVDRAVEAAEKAMPIWSGMIPKERSTIMLKIADIIENQFEEFANAESRDQGKPVWLAKAVDIPRTMLNFRFFATAILHQLNESSQQPEFDAMSYTVQYPAGVAGLITPWNLPLYLLSFKVAPAIAAGCCVVVKPSEVTSVTAWMLCDVFNQAGLPPGVINMVFGTGKIAGSAIVKHPKVKVLSFTGSTSVGKFIQEQSADHIKKLSLELGGKNAGIVFSDANLDKCITTCVKSAFANQGEICLCTSRLFVQEDIFEAFCKKYVDIVRSTLKVGPPEEDTSKLGALVSKEHLAKVKFYIKLALEEGGEILCGETVDPPLELPEKNAEGYFCQPTVIVGLKDDARCMQEEIFELKDPLKRLSLYKNSPLGKVE